MKHSIGLRTALLLTLGLLPGGCGGSFDGADRIGDCESPKTDPTSGLVTCSEGYSHRAQAVACQVSDDSESGSSKPVADGTVQCEPNDDTCDAFLLGYCDNQIFLNVCRTGCRVDADCGAGSVCLCTSGPTPHGGECVLSECATDADCGGGALCTSTSPPCSRGGFACQNAADECATGADCKTGICDRVDGRRICSTLICGRPFLVETEPRVAPVVNDPAWGEHPTPRVSHLTAAQRAELAAHWTKLGQMEHASIAAFARFQLQLLALGAPPELVQACNQALIDETAHTRLCFGLASAYAGQGIGPGPLDVAHSLDVASLADIVDLVIVEGCFGETNAALEALEAADRATDPVIRSAYARIAEDEERHAELAFRFVRWALQRDRASVAERILAALPHAPAGVRDVAVPCLRALIEQPLAA